MTDVREYNQWLVIDWKTGESRTRKSKPSASSLTANELLAELKINVEVPDVPVPTLGVDIAVPEPQVYQANMDALDAEDLPDWTEAAEEVLAESEYRIEDFDDTAAEWADLIDALTTRTLMNAPGRPPTDKVREYIDERATQLYGGDGE